MGRLLPGKHIKESHLPPTYREWRERISNKAAILDLSNLDETKQENFAFICKKCFLQIFADTTFPCISLWSPMNLASCHALGSSFSFEDLIRHLLPNKFDTSAAMVALCAGPLPDTALQLFGSSLKAADQQKSGWHVGILRGFNTP